MLRAFRHASTPEIESAILEVMTIEAASLSVSTISHIPRSARPLVAQVLAAKFNNSVCNNLWGFARIFILAKSELRSSVRGGKKKIHVVSLVLQTRLRHWQAGDLVSVWMDARADARKQSQRKQNSSQYQINDRCVIFFTTEGRSLGFHGCASEYDLEALEELRPLHPVQDLPEWSNDVHPSLCASSTSALEALKSFLKASSHGFSNLGLNICLTQY